MVVTALSTQNREQDTRQQLILDHYPLVRTIACRMVRRFPSCVDVDELINVGALGLMDAVDRFDPSREVPFKAYAEIRIRGAIVDALREADWVPRSVRRKYNKIENARATLHRQLGRDPSRAELAHALSSADTAQGCAALCRAMGSPGHARPSGSGASRYLPPEAPATGSSSASPAEVESRNGRLPASRLHSTSV